MVEPIRANPDPLIPLLIGGFIFLCIGILCVAFPGVVRKYDSRMTRFIKDEDYYVITTRLFGALCLLSSAGMLGVALFLIVSPV